MPNTEIFSSALEATKDIPHGAFLLVGGFGLCGIPELSIEALRSHGVQNLQIASNNCGVDDFGLGRLLETKQINKMISSYVGENKEFERQFLSKEIEVELVPQGTLAERLRAGGAGIPAFFTPAGVGTPIAEGRETRAFGGKPHLLEYAIRGDYALVKAYRGDRHGNLVYRRTARNFNTVCATAARITIAEVEELVEPGEIEVDNIHTPGIFVQRIFVGSHQKRIERRMVRT